MGAPLLRLGASRCSDRGPERAKPTGRWLDAQRVNVKGERKLTQRRLLDAVAAGAVAPDVGRVIIDSIKALADVRATEELEARIAALEEKDT